jgi:hypothetical protein
LKIDRYMLGANGDKFPSGKFAVNGRHVQQQQVTNRA